MFNQIKMYLRFARGVREYLKEPLEPEVIYKTIKKRVQDREKNFLATVKKVIYDNTDSPYLKLLNMAGCEYGDLEKMVNVQGTEPTLKKLYQSGVYITLDEFKGKKKIVRGSASFEVSESDFDTPIKSNVLVDHSGASRSSGTRTSYDFEHLTNP